jgi:mannose-6-phosphate isomerase-like protein (cupin superfamily)
VKISGEAKKHYHKTLTEYYVVLEGAGEIEMNDTLVAVESGDVLMIPPGTRHALRGKFEIINVVVPPFDPEDEYLVE